MKIKTMHLHKLEYLQIGVFLYLAVALIKGSWAGDFWEHAAIVKQFSHSYTDNHPLLDVKKPHAFYSPYLFVLGFIVKYTGLSVIRTLTIAGFINLISLLYVFPKFIISIFHNKEIAFYSLLFTLFFWYSPYSYSGFLSINVLNYVLPYPSTFAIILTLMLFVVYQSNKIREKYLVLLVIVTSSIIIITHPLTGIVNCLALFSIRLNTDGIKFTKNWIFFISSMIITFSLVFSWPYYSFIELIKGAANVYHSSNKLMYINPILRTFPAILSIPLIINQCFKKENKTLLIIFFVLISIYILGFIFEKWSYGRLISFIVLICHIYLASFVVQIKEMSKFKTTLLLNTLISLAFFIFAYRNINISYFRPLNQWMVSENKYRKISEHLFEEDVVFSLSNESWPIPSFGPKIISCIHAQAFINDSEIREKDTDLFFTETLLSDSVRWDIIKKYKINKILVPLDFQPDIKLNHLLSKNTTLIFKDKKYLLSKITLHNTFSNKK